MRVAYLGPPGTFSEDALSEAGGNDAIEPVPAPSVVAAIEAVSSGETERALVPFENSVEGAVHTTLDALAFEARDVVIIGAHDLAIHHCLIAARPLEVGAIEVLISHTQGIAQCGQFIRQFLRSADLRTVESTAEAVRLVCDSSEPWAAIGARSAAALYGGTVLEERIEDESDNVTRFVWLARRGTLPDDGSEWRTSLVFSELGADHPGALVDALQCFAARAVNLTRIESRPLRGGFGRYMFFVDLDGSENDQPVAEAIADLRGHAESVRSFGSYPLRK